jgi:hypothetical protein
MSLALQVHVMMIVSGLNIVSMIPEEKVNNAGFNT